MKTFLTSLIVFFSVFSFSQEKKYQLSTHILDITTGTPGAGVTVILEKQKNNKWVKIEEQKTDDNGRISNFLEEKSKPDTGIYRLTFNTQPYFKSKDIESFYPFIQVVFEIKDGKHYHVPITLSPFGYSTYRGS